MHWFIGVESVWFMYPELAQLVDRCNNMTTSSVIIAQAKAQPMAEAECCGCTDSQVGTDEAVVAAVHQAIVGLR